MKRLLVPIAMAASLVTGSAAISQSTSTSGSIAGSISGAGAQSNPVVTTNSGSLSDANAGSTSNSVSSPVVTTNSASVSGSNSGSNSNSQSNSNPVTTTTTTTATASDSKSGAAASNAGNTQNITSNSYAPNRVKVVTTPPVYSPALTTTLTETCMGSSSLGVSVLGWGASGGTTWSDHQCVRRLNARELAQTIGDREAAKELLCGDDEIFRVYNALGRPCRLTPRGGANPAWVTQPQQSAYGAPPAVQEYAAPGVASAAPGVSNSLPPSKVAMAQQSQQQDKAQPQQTTYVAPAPPGGNTGSQYVVYFPAGISDVPREYSLVLDKAADAYQTYGFAKVMVNGRPTPGGSENDFAMLSQRRAEAVKAYLIAKGVPAEAQMVAAIHAQAVAQAIATRRVEIVFASTVMP
jgi:outer membrane protein OmpA-like peptidoglycan-associated protein